MSKSKVLLVFRRQIQTKSEAEIIDRMKIFYKYLFHSPSKVVVPHAKMKLWPHQKLVLYTFRRYSKYRDVPNEITYFDWQLAMNDLSRYVFIVKWVIIYVAVFGYLYSYKQKEYARVEQLEKEMAERKEKYGEPTDYVTDYDYPKKVEIDWEHPSTILLAGFNAFLRFLIYVAE